jgi:hypothetical protein
VKLKLQKNLNVFWVWAKDFFWRRQSIYGFLLLVLLAFIVIQLSIIPSNFANVESSYSTETSIFSNIGQNPLSLPHKLATYVTVQVSDSIRSVRAVSIVILGFSVIALYRIIKRWHSEKIALFTAAMFGLNATSLAVGRLGAPLVLILCWSIIISILMWLQHGKSRKIAPVVLLIISAALIYVPGAPYFFILLIVLFGKKLLKISKSLSSKTIYTGIIFSVILIGPLFYSFYNDINLVRNWFLIPQSIDWSSIISNILKVPSAFIYKSPVNPLLNVGTLPVLDVASGGLFLIGLYAYQKNSKLERTKIMILTAAFGIILGALGEVTIGIVLLLPFVYSVIAAGISFILDEWYSVFPRNPIARSFGLLLVTFVILMSIYYQTTRFFVVWPQTPETRQVYDQPNLIQY